MKRTLAVLGLPEALYAEVSEIPADESTNIPATILRLSEMLTTPEGKSREQSSVF